MTPTSIRHPYQDSQTLYPFIQNIIGEQAFNELPIITDPRILNHIGPYHRMDIECFNGKVTARLCRGSYELRYSILFFECIYQNGNIPFIVTDCSRPHCNEGWFALGMFSSSGGLYFRNPELKRFLGELFSDYATDAAHLNEKYRFTLPPLIKLS